MKTPTHRKTIVEFINTSRTYAGPSGPTTVLANVNLSIDTNEYVAITGKSGSGKSTMLNMLTGIDHPTHGKVQVCQTNIHDLNENDLARWRGKNIGIVFQFFQLMPTLTIKENILLAMDFVSTIERKQRSSRADQLLESVALSQHSQKFPAELSGGEQQRAAIARALANDPPLLVADEPTGNLDSRTASSIRAIFDQLIANGKTVIVVTHEDVSRLNFNRIISLQDGSIVADRKV